MHCNTSGIFCLSPGSPFAGKARLFIWRSVNIKHTTRAAPQLAASACSRRSTEQQLWEQIASTFEITVPSACSAPPCITWASTPFLLCAFLWPLRTGVSGLAALPLMSWTQREQTQVSLFHVYLKPFSPPLLRLHTVTDLLLPPLVLACLASCWTL